MEKSDNKRKGGKLSYTAPAQPIEDRSRIIKLTGGVKHSESLPPVNSKLNVGAVFDEKELEKPEPARKWYRVPKWLVGRWESDSQTTTFIDDYTTGKTLSGGTIKNHGVANYGKQQDRAGNVWDCVYYPEEVQNESGDTINKDLNTKEELLKNNESELVTRDTFIRRRINKLDNKIAEVTQMEQISRMVPAGKDKMQVWGSLKTFDRQGKRLELIGGNVIYKHTAPFKAVNFDTKSHEDLRVSFSSYLRSQGLSNLIPNNR